VSKNCDGAARRAHDPTTLFVRPGLLNLSVLSERLTRIKTDPGLAEQGTWTREELADRLTCWLCFVHAAAGALGLRARSIFAALIGAMDEADEDTGRVALRIANMSGRRVGADYPDTTWPPPEGPAWPELLAEHDLADAARAAALVLWDLSTPEPVTERVRFQICRARALVESAFAFLALRAWNPSLFDVPDDDAADFAHSGPERALRTAELLEADLWQSAGAEAARPDEGAYAAFEWAASLGVRAEIEIDTSLHAKIRTAAADACDAAGWGDIARGLRRGRVYGLEQVLERVEAEEPPEPQSRALLAVQRWMRARQGVLSLADLVGELHPDDLHKVVDFANVLRETRRSAEHQGTTKH
jgi:hypothetical protein